MIPMTSLETSKQLLKVGFCIPTTELYWAQAIPGEQMETYYPIYHSKEHPHEWGLVNEIPAYTFDMLIEGVLKTVPVKDPDITYQLIITPDYVGYIDVAGNYLFKFKKEDYRQPLVEPLAKLIIAIRNKYRDLLLG